MGALMLRERGLLTLDDPVKKFLPDFSKINPYEPHEITLRELMGEVSVLPRELCGFSTHSCPVNEAAVLKFLAEMELVRPPLQQRAILFEFGIWILCNYSGGLVHGKNRQGKTLFKLKSCSHLPTGLQQTSLEL
ncbi:unnamed protein product [Calypogeia fissa]